MHPARSRQNFNSGVVSCRASHSVPGRPLFFAVPGKVLDARGTVRFPVCAGVGRTSRWGGYPRTEGGIIPPADAEALRAAGVARVYTPKDFDITAILADIVAVIDGSWREAA